MSVQEACLLKIGEAQLLLYGMGARNVYGFAPKAELTREDALQLYAEMVRNNVLIPQDSALVLQEPWRSCLMQWRTAKTVVRFHAPTGGLPDTCLYPGEKAVLAVTLQQRRPEMLRLTELPHDQVWNWLTEQYDLPQDEWNVLPQDGEEARAPQQLEAKTDFETALGLLFVQEYVCLDGRTKAKLAAVQQPLSRKLLYAQENGITEQNYSVETVQNCLQQWLLPEKEDAS